MPRLSFIKRITRTCLFGMLASTSAFAAPIEKPNILIILADDMGYGDLSIQNPNSKIPTPELDRLAHSGLRLTNGHSSSGICTPSRYSLFTGRYHWRDFHGIVESFGPSVFKAEQLTLPELLQANGYHTAAIGKWHLGWDWDALRTDVEPLMINKREVLPPEAFDWTQPIPDGPLAHGFDHYFGDSVINFPPYCWIEDDRVTQVPTLLMDTDLWKPIKEGSWECRGGPMVEGWDPYESIPTITDHAVAYIHAQANEEQPFFLYFALPSPHAPIIPNDAFDGKSAAGPYGDFVYETDAACGRILDALEASGQAENTIVIFTADNGPEHYAYPRDIKYDHWSSAPFRGLKRDLYEGGHHVPFLIRWPGHTQAGSTSDALVSQIDLMATLAAAIDAEIPAEQAVDSQSLLPLIQGKTSNVREHHVHNTKKDQYAIRKGDWVLINTRSGYMTGVRSGWEEKHGYVKPATKPEFLLFNLKTDPAQRNDVAAEHPEIVQSLQDDLKRIRAEQP